VSDTLQVALQGSGLNQVKVLQRPRLVSDNGPSYVSSELGEWLEDNGIRHIRGRAFRRRSTWEAVHAAIDLQRSFLSFEQLDSEISNLRLALYHPTAFLRDDLPTNIRAAYDNKIFGGFTQEGRERILIAMMKVNFLKRLESSIDSFRLTLRRTIDKIDRLEERIAAFETHLDDNPNIDYDTLTRAERPC
jgi:hypothetical protein